MLTRLRNLLPTALAVVALVLITGPYVVEARREPARFGLVPPATSNPPTTRVVPTSRLPPTTGAGSSTSATFPPSTVRHPTPGPTGTSGGQLPLSTPTLPAVPTPPKVTVPPTTLPTVTTPPRVTLPSIPRIICRPPPSQPHPDRDPTKPCLPERKKP